MGDRITRRGPAGVWSGRPTLAIVPWGTVFEDYLDPLGLTLEEFRTSMTGGWLFNYVRALEIGGIDPVITVFSGLARRPVYDFHPSTGVRFVTVPVRPVYRWTRNAAHRLRSRPRRDALDTGDASQKSSTGAGVLAGMWELLRYVSTPVALFERVLREIGADGILCQEYESERFDVCVRVGRRLGLPVFASFQGGDRTVGAVARRRRGQSIRAAAGLIIGSRREASRVVHEHGVSKERIGRFPNPFGMDEVGSADREGARRDLEITPDAAVVAWHGRVDIHAKGLDLLVEAWRMVCRDIEPGRAVLLLVGSAADDDAFRLMLRKRLDDRCVRWVDRFIRDRAEIYRYLSAADIYAFPSRREGFPVAPIEAMACGLPLVAAQAHGVDEIVPGGADDGAVRVPAEDPEALARALGCLIADPARSLRLGRAARERVQTHFSLEAVGREMSGWLGARGLDVRDC